MQGKPVILAVDDDPLALDRVVDELERRYGRDYDVRGVPTYVVINKEGKIAHKGHDWEETLAAALKANGESAP